MELRSFEKPYVALLISANTAYNQPYLHEAWSLELHGCIFQHPNRMWGQEIWLANPVVQELVSGSRISF